MYCSSLAFMCFMCQRVYYLAKRNIMTDDTMYYNTHLSTTMGLASDYTDHRYKKRAINLCDMTLS